MRLRVLAPAEGELNACIIIEDMYGTEILALNAPYVFEMTAGETRSFIVATQNYNADTINLVISQ